uniref:(California timema) hypothetical protein n=1 Tax=Timema californicum TaxID=61474 RepID=A0A7R9J0A9_TIMCA|nr:unnamed protein product [Timema californicum]
MQRYRGRFPPLSDFSANDVDLDNQGLSYNTNSGSSSNSSLSTRSLDSPSNSLEMVTGPRTQEAVTVTLTPNSSGALYDSDLEAEPDPPDWGPRGVDLKNLSDKEKKRQDVINELFHSERSHVRHLKVLDQVFYRPMLDNQVLPSDHIQLLFSNLDQMLDIHSQFNNKMKSKRRESHVVTEVADLLFGMFDGPAGEEFQRAAATFCARQQIALELLKERRRKDAKLNNFLTDAEGNPLCRRLQLKDIIPTGMQRLTKYPLLFENLAKHTEEGTEELSGVQRALERSKEILNHVNQAKREAEDHQRLSDIMRRLDRSGFEKVDHPMAGEFKNLDLTKHRLIHEGPLNWRIGNRQKLIDLHVLLLEDVIILLQKQDEKFVLKFYNMNTAGGGVERSPTLSPIIKVSTVLVRHNAVDKKALYLVNTSQNGAQIYDLVATSSAERKIRESGATVVNVLALCSPHLFSLFFSFIPYTGLEKNNLKEINMHFWGKWETIKDKTLNYTPSHFESQPPHQETRDETDIPVKLLIGTEGILNNCTGNRPGNHNGRFICVKLVGIKTYDPFELVRVSFTQRLRRAAREVISSSLSDCDDH